VNKAPKSGTVLSLDLSTNSTGFALFEVKTKKVLKYGAIHPKVPGLSKMKYPESALMKILDMTAKIKALILETSPDIILVEEVNRGISRIGQKALDSLHFFVLDAIRVSVKDWTNKIVYMDSNGKKGWRGKLGLKLSTEDKFFNLNSRNSGNKDKVINWKVLAQRWVNANYQTKFDVKLVPEDADICDAIAMGAAFLKA